MSETESTPGPLSVKCERTECPNRNSTGHTLKKCGGCRRVFFCSVECQKATWSQHKALCKKLQNPEARKALPSYKTMMESHEKAYPFWHGPQPASERIHWFSTMENSSHGKVVREYIKRLDMEQIIQYAMEKFIVQKDRGAVMLDFSKPVPIVHGRGTFQWMTTAVAKRTGDRLVINSVTEYDPIKSAVIFLYMIEPQGRFIHLASIEPLFTAPPGFAEEILEVKRQL
ncbi:hypothetical protein M422DRAFT_72254 [Sphaerobolus stellatus SS14]|uniref:MYND-type domain-containing protein n=1 Tax=Sphaerobolus stellatus (strain SS14) TaxID=990650 RepID=A0A0C9UIP6_SPHS4|nr:hypothetical protein M422DRAFT_72254 [Sphaerobolus stellatus SS14]